MRKQKTMGIRIISLLLCWLLIGSFTVCSEELSACSTALFIGNTDTPNRMIKSYAELTGEFLQTKFGHAVDIVSAAALDIDDKSFLKIVETELLPINADIIFWEINLSKKNKGTEKEIQEKVATVIEGLCSGDKLPAIYFVYVPEASFLDYRKPYDAVANYYGIPVIDSFSVLKKQYTSKELETKDFLSAGLVIGEDGHPYLSKLIQNALLASNAMKTPDLSKKAIGNLQKYRISEEELPIQYDPEDGAAFYVAKTGSDTASGTIESPFATLERAKNAVRNLKNKQGDAFRGAVVYIREGDYRFDNTFTLKAEDSATDNTRIVYRAYPGEKVRFTNANTLDPKNWQLVTDEATLLRLREHARGKVYVYNLRKNGIDPGTYRENNQNNYRSRDGSNRKMGSVFVANGITEGRAAYPNRGYSRVSQSQTAERDKIYYDDIVGDRWKTADNVWMKGMLNQGYYTDYIKVTGFDFEKNTINLAVNAAYGVTAGHAWSIFNLLEELDMESEWYADEKTGLLYYYPRGNILEQEILYSTNRNAIVSMNGTKNITFQGIEFTACSGSAIEINDGIANTVESCKIGNTGFYGVGINCTKNKIGPGKNGVTDCYIYNTAISGVTINGGDRKFLTPQYDYVMGCFLENYSYENHSETAALQSINAVGAIFQNNTIHNDDSCAIWMGGNDELIEYNEIYNVGWETDDYGVVYGTSTGALTQGVTFRNNYFHDCIYSAVTYVYGKLATIYFDALRNNGAIVENNAFIRCDEPIFLATNQNMSATGNISLDCKKGVVTGYYSHASTGTIPALHERIKQEAEDNSIFKYTAESQAPDRLVWRSILEVGRKMTDEEWQSYYLKYPWVEHYLERGPLVHRDNVASGNASFNSSEEKGISLPIEAAHTVDISNNYITKDSIAYSESGSEAERMNRAMGIATEKIDGFTPWDVREAGGLKQEIPIGNFQTLYPADNQENIDLKVFPLCWDFASGADEYTVTVATDPDFKNIVFEEKTNMNYIHPTGLKYGGKRYYWKVQAKSYNEKIIGQPENKNGVRSFVTKQVEDIDKKDLVIAISNTKTLLEQMTEGTDGGMYPVGTKTQLSAMLEEAVKLNENQRVKQEQVVKMAEQLEQERLKAMSRIILQETNLADVLNAPENALIGAKATSGIGDSRLHSDADGIRFKGQGSVFANRDFGLHEIIHFKAKFDFSGVASPSNYTLFSIRAQNYSEVLYDVTNYAFLVTKENIELQAFKKPTNEGKMYLTIPNTFIEEGKEYHIEFGAIPWNDGKSIRLLLAVNGTVIYDEIDSTNMITKSGKVGFANSRDTHGLKIMQPDSDLPYPLLVERLNDPNSDLNQ